MSRAMSVKKRVPLFNMKTSLVTWTVNEIQHAVLQEPAAAIESNVKYTASSMLPNFVFPALTEYFQRHYTQHSQRLPPSHQIECENFVRSVMEFADHLKELHARTGSKTIKLARKATRALIVALHAVTSLGRVPFLAVRQSMISDEESAYGPSQSSRLSSTLTSPRAVQGHWVRFISSLSTKIGVEVNESNWDCVEVRSEEPGRPKVQYFSLYVMARILSQPHMSPAEWTPRDGKTAAIPLGWTYEEVCVQLSKFLIQQHETVDWTEEMLVKMIRSMSYACNINDGHGDPDFIQEGWKACMDIKFVEHMRPEQLIWTQNKYNDLGFTHAAIALMTNSKLSVQLEALRLFLTLLHEGNVAVQNTFHALMVSDLELSELWFDRVGDIIERCSEYIKKYSADQDDVGDGGENLDEFDEENDEFADTLARLNDSGDPVLFAAECVSMLRLLCEGHHMENQLLLQDQPKNEKRTDLVAETVVMLGNLQNSLVDAISSGENHAPRLVITLFEFLQEACLGPCYPVQLMLTLNSNLLLMANRMLGYIVIDDTDNARVAKTKAGILSALLQLLYGLLEGRMDERVASRIKDVLDFGALEKQMLVLDQIQRLKQGGDGSRQSGGSLHKASVSSHKANENLEDHVEASYDSTAGQTAGKLTDPPAAAESATELTDDIHGNSRKVVFLEGAGKQEKQRPRPSLQLTNGSPASAFRTGKSLFDHLELLEEKDADEAFALRGVDGVTGALENMFLDLVFFLSKLKYVTGSSNLLWTAVGHMESDAAALQASIDLKGTADSVRQRMDDFMGKNTASIELLWNDNLEKVYFPLTEICRDVNTNQGWKNEMNEYLMGVPSSYRANPLQKAINLLGRMEVVVSDLNASHHLKAFHPWLWMITESRRHLWQLAFYLALVVLTLMILTIEESAWEWQHQRQPWSYWTSFGLCVVGIFVTVLLAATFMYHDFRRWREVNQPAFGNWVMRKLGSITSLSHLFPGVGRMSGKVHPKGSKDPVTALTFWSLLQQRRTKNRSSYQSYIQAITSSIPAPPKEHQHEGLAKLMNKIVVPFLDMLCFWKGWYIFAMLVAAVLGATVSPFFITFHLTVFFLEFDAGKSMVLALSKAGMPLVKTSLMGIVVILVFAVGSYVFFRDFKTMPCTTLYQCVATHMVTGMYGDFAGLYASDELFSGVPESIADDSSSQLRILYVMAFFIIWGFVLSNIFTGQIVDAFAEIRGEVADVQLDNTTHCLVCSLERFEFDKNPKTSFETHIDLEHNPLAYVFYLHYLSVTKKMDYKGYDTAVTHILKSQSHVDRASWLPISRSITLENADNATRSLEEASEKQTDILEYLRVMIQRMDVRIDGLETQMASVLSAGQQRPMSSHSAPAAAADSGGGEAAVLRFEDSPPAE